MSSRRNGAVAGGLLAGLGEGIQRKAEIEALSAIAEQEQAREDARALAAARRRRFERAEDREFQRGLIYRTEVSDAGEVIGITRGGDKIPLGFKQQKTAARMEEERLLGRDQKAKKGMTAGEERDYKSLLSANTTEDADGKKTTNWRAVIDGLRNLGNDRLADALETGGKGQADTSIDPSSRAWRDARAQAEEEADERTGFFSSRASEFPESRGSMSRWIEDRAREIYFERRGQTGGGATVSPGGATNGAPPGAGTQADPYRATTQSDVDWFKAQAPAGSVIEIDGQLYTK